MTSRQRFEATANDTIRSGTTFFLFDKFADGGYISEMTARAFSDWQYAWQAAERDMLNRFVALLMNGTYPRTNSALIDALKELPNEPNKQ